MSTPLLQPIPVVRLLRPQGRRGELLAEPLSDLPGIFVAGRTLHVHLPSSAQTVALEGVGDAGTVTVEGHWSPTGRNAGRVVLKLIGVDSIAAAETLAGLELQLEESELPALEADTFLVRDLLGCTLFDHDRPAGEIVDVEFPTGPDGRTRLEDAAPLLVVNPLSPKHAADAQGAGPVLVPFVKAWLQHVDLAAHRITMNLPEGLFTLSEGLPHEADSRPAVE